MANSFAIIVKRRGGSSKQLVTWVLTLFTSEDDVKVFSKFLKSYFLLLRTCTTTATHPGGLVNTGARQRRESDPHGNGEVLPWRRLASLASGHVTRWQPPALLSNVRFLRSALASWVQALVVERTASPSEHWPLLFGASFEENDLIWEAKYIKELTVDLSQSLAYLALGRWKVQSKKSAPVDRLSVTDRYGKKYMMYEIGYMMYEIWYM